MRTEIVSVIDDETGAELWFVDRRTALGSLVASEMCSTRAQAEAYAATLDA